jgi:hypothetical protein
VDGLGLVSEALDDGEELAVVASADEAPGDVVSVDDALGEVVSAGEAESLGEAEALGVPVGVPATC